MSEREIISFSPFALSSLLSQKLLTVFFINPHSIITVWFSLSFSVFRFRTRWRIFINIFKIPAYYFLFKKIYYHPLKAPLFCIFSSLSSTRLLTLNEKIKFSSTFPSEQTHVFDVSLRGFFYSNLESREKASTLLDWPCALWMFTFFYYTFLPELSFSVLSLEIRTWKIQALSGCWKISL